MKDLYICGIETSGKVASVCIYDNVQNEIIGETSVKSFKTQSQIILPLLSDLLKHLSLDIKDIGLISISKGPGSYTGIRIGIAAAKAICFALNINVCGVSSLFSLAVKTCEKNMPVCSIIKARQDLVYASVYKNPCNINFETILNDCIIKKDDLNNFLNSLNSKVLLTGIDAGDFKEKYTNDNFILADKFTREQTSDSLVKASLYLDKINPIDLNASYLQSTEAERNLKNKKGVL